MSEDDGVVDESFVSDRIEYIRTLQNGWYDGHGEAFDNADLDWLREALIDLIKTHEVKPPCLFPRPDNGISVEWFDTGDYRMSMDVYFDDRVGGWLSYKKDGKYGDEVDIDFDLSNPDSWASISKIAKPHCSKAVKK